jgi:two-component system chemotaxis response regulator CheB
MNPVRVICVGASAGGITAVQRLLNGLPKLFSLPLVVVQHLHPSTELDVDLVYGRGFSGKVLEARDKMPLEGGTAYFAPPTYHLLIEKDLSLSLSQDEPVNFSRPSIDVLFESAAWAVGDGACGVLLTGANHDGAAGLRQIKDLGGVTIVQDPEEAEVPYMPNAAIELQRPDFILKIDDIAAKLSQMSSEGTSES